MDGFDQDKTAREAYDPVVALVGLFASHRDAFEPFQLADALLDASARLVQQFRKEFGPIFGVGSIRDNRDDTAVAARGTVLR